MKLKVLIVSVCLLVATGLFFVSILGENKKIDQTVIRYFENIKNNNYISLKGVFADNYADTHHISDADFFYDIFLTEISLLKYSNLEEVSDYNVKIKKDKLWIPYFSDPVVYVDLLIKDKNNFNLKSYLGRSDEKAYVNKLFALRRNKGKWRIVDIRTEKTNLLPIYSSYKADPYFRGLLEGIKSGSFSFLSKRNAQELALIEKKAIRFFLSIIEDDSLFPKERQLGLILP